MIQRKRKKALSSQEFKKILPKHYKHLEDTLWGIALKMFTKICNRGFYHYPKKPSIEGVGVYLDSNPKEIHRLCVWVRIGKKTYQTESDVCPPYIPWFDDSATKSSPKLKAKTNKKK